MIPTLVIWFDKIKMLNITKKVELGKMLP